MQPAQKVFIRDNKVWFEKKEMRMMKKNSGHAKNTSY